ncbi:expressed unknown protein [Seminavis robusta]|uniref:Uncharacterized protein n=1 Tax=Seminavis robusta TaxID=568900 RepID=A0A9N8DQ71_9STRA|nr:expressed unknown protein [Seminavis robusta]|eukprot:Sro206_g086550.1 n/a (786) ;mRNA; r:43287-45644
MKRESGAAAKARHKSAAMLLVDYTRTRAVVGSTEQRRRTIPVPTKVSKRSLPCRRATYGGHHQYRRSMSLMETQPEVDEEEELEDSKSRINFRIKRRSSMGASYTRDHTSSSISTTTEHEPTYAEKFQKSLTDLFAEEDEEEEEPVNGDDSFFWTKCNELDMTERTEGETTITSTVAAEDDLGPSCHFVDTRKFNKGKLGMIVSTIDAVGPAKTEDDDCHPQTLLSTDKKTEEEGESNYVDTSKFCRGRKQPEPESPASTTTKQQARDLPRDLAPPLSASSAQRPTFWRRMSQQRMGEEETTKDHTRRRLTRLSSLKKMQESSMSDINTTIIGSRRQARQQALARSSSMKQTSLREVSETGALPRSSSMKSFKRSELSESDHRRENQRMKRVHSLRNVMGDISDPSQEASSNNDSITLDFNNSLGNLATNRRTTKPKRNFSTLNFAGDFQSGPRLDRRAGLLGTRGVSSMGNLARDLMDDKSSRNHYYKGCSMRNLMSDSFRTLGSLLKQTSERNLLNESKRTLNNESISRLNMMRQISGRNLVRDVSARSLLPDCSEQVLEVDRLNMMRQNSNKNILKRDSTRKLMMDLSEQAMDFSARAGSRRNLLRQDSNRSMSKDPSSRRQAMDFSARATGNNRNLLRQDSNRSMSKDQSAIRRQNRRLLNRKSASMRNLDGSAYEGSQRRRLGFSNSFRGLCSAAEVDIEPDTGKRGLARCRSDLETLQSRRASSGKKEKREPAEEEQGDNRLALLVGSTISFRSNSSRNLCRSNSGQDGSPKQLAARAS